MGIESSSGVINSSTTVEVSFDKGVPVSQTASALVLRFDHKTLNEQIYAVQNDIELLNESDLSGSTADLSCSFQGGCSYTITGTGLTSSLLNSDINNIDVCGNPCVIDQDASDATQATCTLPHVSTAYSAAEYDIVVSGLLHDGTWTGTASDIELARLIDGKNMVDMVDSSTTCHFQIQYKENHVGVLDEVKFFVNEMVDKSTFVGTLIF